MSRYTVEQLEKEVAAGNFEKETVTVDLYRDKRKPFQVKKVCPYCKKVYDSYLLFAGPLIGCKTCALKNSAKVGLRLAKERIDLITDEMKKV